MMVLEVYFQDNTIDTEVSQDTEGVYSLTFGFSHMKII